MQYQYVVSAQKASSVAASVSGAFIAPHETNLILAKGNRLEIHGFAAQSLNLVAEYQLNGRIASLHFFHPSDRLTGLILVTSEKFQFAVISWDAAEHCVVTESTGEIFEVTGRPATEGKLVAVDSECRLIAIYAYQGIVHLFPMQGALNSQALSGWRSLLRVCYSGSSSSSSHNRRGSSSIGELGGLSSAFTGDQKWPYAVRTQFAGKLTIPKYLNDAQSNSHVDVDDTELQGKSKGKGKAAAQVVRSTDIYPVLTRYIMELKVLDMQFLKTGPKQPPEFAVLFEDANMTRQVHVYQVCETQGELQPVSSWTSAPVESSASKLVSLPNGAIMVISDEALVVVAENSSPLSISKRSAAVTAWQWIDAEKCERLLISDYDGVLSLVVLQYARDKGLYGTGASSTARSAGNVQDLFVERLGDIPPATSLSYLFGGCVYIGSHCGDQRLVCLHTQPLSESEIDASNQLALHPSTVPTSNMPVHYDPLAYPLGPNSSIAKRTSNTFIEPLQVYQSLAPIVDLSVVGVNEDQQQQSPDVYANNDLASAYDRQHNISGTEMADSLAEKKGGEKHPTEERRRANANYGSVVTCSGLRNSTSLRMVRNGVGIEKLATVDIDGLLGIWSLTVDSESPKGSSTLEMDVEQICRQVVIVLSLVQRTCILGWTEPSQSPVVELAELNLPGWRLSEQTLSCSLTADRKHVIQVTTHAVVLIDALTWQQQASWEPAQIGLSSINAASIYNDQLAVAVDGTTVAYLEVQSANNQLLACVAQRKLDNAVSCINIRSLSDQHNRRAEFIAVGMWGINDVCLLTLPNLGPASVVLSLDMPNGIFTQSTSLESTKAVEAATAAMRLDSGNASGARSDSDKLPRSILMSALGGTPYLLVGLGDGRLHQFALRQVTVQQTPDTTASTDVEPHFVVCEHKCVTLGTRPLILTPFANHGTLSVFAASDHPAVLFANKCSTDPLATQASTDNTAGSSGISRLLYANVDASDVLCAAPIESSNFPESLCLVSSTGSLWIGQSDPVQRLHVHSFPLPSWATPHRVAYNGDAAVFGVATIHTIDPDTLAVSPADSSLWEKEALMETNAQQAKLISDVRGDLVLSPPAEVGRFTLLEAQTMNILGSVLLRPYEMPESLCVATLKCLPRPPTSISSSAGAREPSNAARLDSAEASSSADVVMRNADSLSSDGPLENVFILGTSIVMPGQDDSSCGRVLVIQWDSFMRRTRIIGCFTTHSAVYSLVPFRGMLLAGVGSRLLLLGWQQRDPGMAAPSAELVPKQLGENIAYMSDPGHELVVLCSQQTQIVSLSTSVNGDYIAVGDIMSSVSLYKYEEIVKPLAVGSGQSQARSPPLQSSLLQSQQQQSTTLSNQASGAVIRRLAPVSKDYAGAWTTCVAAVPQPLAQNVSCLYPDYVDDEAGLVGNQQIPSYAQSFRNPSQERFLLADAYDNIIRLSRAVKPNGSVENGSEIDDQRLYVEARWHLGDMINVVRPGSLVMDIPDPEFPDYFRPVLVYGTLRGAVGVVASVENGKLGRILDRLQINMAHLVPTPGMWDYDQWRAYSSDQRNSRAFGVLDGDLIEQFLDLPRDIQQVVFTGGGALADREAVMQAEHMRKADYWKSYSRVEAEGEVAVLAQMAVSDIEQREKVTLDYVVRLVESLTRLH
ncbi:mono-functional DNA-alkylating methyl methanesulfonate N-term-domain-containing protein [Coemansia spiralis]|nr:mono-functional DNA-alkylating methyl methanesulfonate N-term-domain-containing protein [Coemansia spiralis]